MRKSVFKIITIVAICFITAVCIFVGADIIKSRQLSIDTAQESLDYMSENCANEFRAVFDNGEFAVTDLAAVVEETIIVDEIFEDSAYYDIRIDELKLITRRITENSKYPISIYITFNPEIFREDIWYVKQLDGQINDVSAEGSELDYWLQEWRTNEFLQGFYKDTLKNGNMWFEAFYDTETGWDVVSRTKAVFDKNGNEIGIVGVDIYLGDISETLANVNERTEGISSVVNSNGQLVAGSKITIEDLHDNKNIYSVAEINDLWKVTILQPVSVATQATGRMIWLTLIMAIVLAAALAAVLYFIYQKHGKSIIREFEEKDILMINQARQAQLGEMVGNVAHQLKQPLNGVNMALDNLKDDYSDSGEFDEKIEKIKFRISNMSETVDSFIGFLRPQKDMAEFSAAGAIAGVIELMDEKLRLESVKVSVLGDDFLITGHRNEFSQCMFNIIDNARNAMLNNKEKKIEIELDRGKILVSNTGSHIEEDILDRLFELYFTTRENDGGSGIGLYMTKSIIESHFHGSVSCHNTDEGVCFIISVPAGTGEENKNEFTE